VQARRPPETRLGLQPTLRPFAHVASLCAHFHRIAWFDINSHRFPWEWLPAALSTSSLCELTRTENSISRPEGLSSPSRQAPVFPRSSRIGITRRVLTHDTRWKQGPCLKPTNHSFILREREVRPHNKDI